MSYTNGLDDPTLYFNTKLYTGNGSTNHAITGVGFQPDWVWIKRRSATNSHHVVDNVRGVGNALASDLNIAEFSSNVSSFDSDGFTLTDSSAAVNASSSTYASWNWLAGGTASSNTDGDITSSVSANTTAGFSIVSYTGSGSTATVGHGLSSAPSMIIIKARADVNSEAQHWIVYHQSLGNTSYQWLNRNIATGTSALGWNDTSPTSNVFSLGNGWTPNNYSGSNYIAYCFAEKKGYSKFGSYTGNGNANGSMIYTGFKPAWIMAKCTSNTGVWNNWDNKRVGYNSDNKRLYANLNNAEGGSNELDILSNGFKLRSTNDANNGSGRTYIYMAFADNPFVTSTGIPTTAR